MPARKDRERERDAASLAQLQGLGGEEQLAYAERLLAASKNLEVLQAALDVVAAGPPPRAREVILATYAQFEEGTARRDPGCHVRVALLRALRPLVQRGERDLLERAVSTFEFLPPGPSEVAAELRAIALVLLDEVDAALAGFHAVHLLAHRHTSSMSGEPAATAARVLATEGQSLVLYAYVLRPEPGASEVLGECLRGLVALPRPLLAPLVERYRDSRDEIVLLGLFDLLLAREGDRAFDDTILGFLAQTRLYNIYRYLVSTIVVGRHAELARRLAAGAEAEEDRTKAEILKEALALRRR